MIHGNQAIDGKGLSLITGPGAQEHLTTATAMYREMDMWFWLEQAEGIMGALP